MAKGWREKYNTDGPRQGWGSGGVVGGGPHPSPLDSHLPLGLETGGLEQRFQLGDSKGVFDAEVFANYQAMRVFDARNDTGATNGRRYQTDRYYQLLSGHGYRSVLV